MHRAYLVLAIVGLIIPYGILLPWVVEHGLNPRLLISDLFSTRAGTFFAADVLISAVVLIQFIRVEGVRRNIPSLWLPVAATCLVGVSCGLPLFLYMREKHSRIDVSVEP